MVSDIVSQKPRRTLRSRAELPAYRIGDMLTVTAFPWCTSATMMVTVAKITPSSVGPTFLYALSTPAGRYTRMIFVYEHELQRRAVQS